MNMPAGWPRVRDVFVRALDRSEAERAAWLRGECGDDDVLYGEVSGLLQAHAQASREFPAAAAQFAAAPDSGMGPACAGQSIGPYRLLRLLGEGGMGRVFLADRADGDFRQQIALKLIRGEIALAEGRERFLREREILARLVHPHIAQLHDGGVATDGAPYFTLEYVEGVPITQYCDAHRLDLRARVALLLQVCAAVAYAHRNLVVHRDIKPSNILVGTDGQAKLLDFGIAKLIDSEPRAGLTAPHARLMTREYAAPEQVLGAPVSTATDVYALGVLLYELACGRTPYARAERGAISWPKAVVEETPQSLERALLRHLHVSAADDPGTAAEDSTGRRDCTQLAVARATTVAALRRALAGDLDRIAQRALQKTAESRYPTVDRFAADLRAWLEHRPISGGSLRYRGAKLARRHWLPLTTAALVAIALGVAVADALWQARQVAREAQSTAAVKDFLLGLFTAVDPREAKGRPVDARDLLERGAQRIEHSFSDRPVLRAELQGVLGRIDYRLGSYEKADHLQQQAISALAADGSQALLLARCEIDRADTLRETGDLATALALATDAAAHLAALPAAPFAERARAATVQASVATMQRQSAAAARYADAAVALARHGPVDAGVLGDALMKAGGAQWSASKLDLAEASYREALAVLLGAYGEEDLRPASARENIAIVLRRKSHFSEALKLTREALDVQQRILGAEHPSVLRNLRNIGLTEYHLGHYRIAREVLEKVAAAQRARFGNDFPELAGTLVDLGLARADDGQPDAAESAFTEALQIWSIKYGPDYEGTTVALGDLGYAHLLQGKFAVADAQLRESIRRNDGRAGSTFDSVSMFRLGETQRRRGDAAQAVRMDRTALEHAIHEYGQASRVTALAHYFLGLALKESDGIEAESELRAALASFSGYIPGADHPLAATVRIELGALLASRAGDHGESTRLFGEAAGIRERYFGIDDPRTRAALVIAQTAKNDASAKNDPHRREEFRVSKRR